MYKYNMRMLVTFPKPVSDALKIQEKLIYAQDTAFCNFTFRGLYLHENSSFKSVWIAEVDAIYTSVLTIY